MNEPKNTPPPPLTLDDLRQYRDKMKNVQTLYVHNSGHKVIGAVLLDGVHLNPREQGKGIDANHAIVFDDTTSLALSMDHYQNWEIRRDPSYEGVLLDLANRHNIPPTHVTRSRVSRDAAKAQSELLFITVSGLGMPDDPDYDVRKDFLERFLGSFGIPKTLLQSWVQYLDHTAKEPTDGS